MQEVISARRVCELMGELSAGPAYAALAEALTLLIGDGRLPLDVRLPSERELTSALGVSRTTVTRAYATLRDTGYARAVQGSGTFTTIPGDRQRAHDRVLIAGSVSKGWIDLNCAADSAPSDVIGAYTAALQDLPPYLSGHGYFPSGLAVLQEAIAATYQARGLPTAPEQIIITPGALTGASVVIRAFASRPTRALLETPTYPNVAEMLRGNGIHLHEAPVDARGWDIAGIRDKLKQVRPDFAYFIPDFQNPTGAVMPALQRQELAASLRDHGVVPIIDETHCALALDGQTMPPPFALFEPESLTLGSLSKVFWGGLRIGWVRAPRSWLDRLIRARMSLDLGVPVLEQLAATHLLREGPVSLRHIERLREQREVLLDAVSEHLPDWRFVRPSGGLALWCELPHRGATALAAALARHQISLSPGPLFSPSGGLDTFVRLPWTRPVAELQVAVERIARAWAMREPPQRAMAASGTKPRILLT